MKALWMFCLILFFVSAGAQSWPENEPAGMTQLAHIKGNTLDWPGWSKNGGCFPGDPEPTRVSVVSDQNSKFGTVVEKRFFAGDISGWGRNSTKDNSGPRWAFPAKECREIYVRFVFKYADNWDFHSGGEKLIMGATAIYELGEVPCASVLYPTFPQGKVTSAGYQWLPIVPGKPTPPSGIGAIQGRQQGYFPEVVRNKYHTVEMWKRKNDPGKVNGSMRFWFDGVEYTRFCKKGATDELRDVTFESVGWDEWRNTKTEAPLYWGGQNDVKKVNDWIRISELYMSMKSETSSTNIPLSKINGLRVTGSKWVCCIADNAGRVEFAGKRRGLKAFNIAGKLLCRTPR